MKSKGTYVCLFCGDKDATADDSNDEDSGGANTAGRGTAVYNGGVEPVLITTYAYCNFTHKLV